MRCLATWRQLWRERLAAQRRHLACYANRRSSSSGRRSLLALTENDRWSTRFERTARQYYICSPSVLTSTNRQTDESQCAKRPSRGNRVLCLDAISLLFMLYAVPNYHLISWPKCIILHEYHWRRILHALGFKFFSVYQANGKTNSQTEAKTSAHLLSAGASE